jgi:hypothetical protein
MQLARPLLAVVTSLLLLIGGAGLAHAIELGAVTLRNDSGSGIGRVDSDGTIRNDSGSSVGRVESDGTIRNDSGSSIGRVDDDGTIRNGSGSSIGRIDGDGTIRNSSGSSVGRVEGYSSGLRHMVAAVLFFGRSVSVLKL